MKKGKGKRRKEERKGGREKGKGREKANE